MNVAYGGSDVFVLHTLETVTSGDWDVSCVLETCRRQTDVLGFKAFDIAFNLYLYKTVPYLIHT